MAPLHFLSGGCMLLSMACGAAPTTAPTPPAPTASKATPQAPPPASDAGRDDAQAVGAPASPPSVPVKVAFPPANFPPPHAQSAREGDGTWVALGDAAKHENAAAEPRLLYRAVVHPHKVSKYKLVTIVAVDLTRARLNITAGVDEPESDAVPKEERSGLIPEADREHVLAAFNGSWQARHGRYGMMKDGKVYLPPRPDGCTIAMFKDGSVKMGSWPSLSASVATMGAWRQAPGCLLENGQLHPDFEKHDERRWGGRDPKRQTRRRSAIALNETGSILFYGFGDETSPKELALGLRAAGAHHAAQLDINYYWVRFLVFGRPKPDAPLQVTSTLIPKMEHRKRGYVHLAEPRDFFYVTRKHDHEGG
jgi:hypothetical protein